MTTDELSELLQKDITQYIDSILEYGDVKHICNIIIDRIREYERANNL